MRKLKFTGKDMGYVLGWSGLFVLMRLYDIPQLVGRIVMELAR
jgi:hypothetical protein